MNPKVKTAKKFLAKVKARDPELEQDLVNKAEWFLSKDKNEYSPKDLKSVFRAELNRVPELDPLVSPDTYGVKVAIDAVAGDKDREAASSAKRLFGNTLDQVFKEEFQKFHMSKKPVTKIKSTRNPYDEDDKPKGFWYSCDHQWLKFVKLEMPYRDHAYYYNVELDYSHILVIDSYEKLLEFDKKYKTKSGWINWKQVSKDYYGIEICPYQHKARLTINWYYGWDIASGCIWNKKAIKQIVSIEKPGSEEINNVIKEEEWIKNKVRYFQIGDTLNPALKDAPARRKKPMKHKSRT